MNNPWLLSWMASMKSKEAPTSSTTAACSIDKPTCYTADFDDAKWKTGANRLKQLLKLGVEEELAKKTAWSVKAHGE